MRNRWKPGTKTLLFLHVAFFKTIFWSTWCFWKEILGKHVISPGTAILTCQMPFPISVQLYQVYLCSTAPHTHMPSHTSTLIIVLSLGSGFPVSISVQGTTVQLKLSVRKSVLFSLNFLLILHSFFLCEVYHQTDTEKCQELANVVF